MKHNILPAFLRSISNQFTNSIGRPMFRFCVFAQPVLSSIFLGLLYKGRSDIDFTSFVYFGSGVMSFWASMAFSSAADIQRERWYGTLENLFASPAGFRTAIIGKIVGNSLWGMISFLINMISCLVLFGRPPVIGNPGLLIAAITLMFISFTAVAYMIAGLFTMSRKSRIFMNMLEAPFFILCGTAFPVEMLPAALQQISVLLAPRWVIHLLRAASRGESFAGATEALFMLVTLSLLYWVAAHFTFNVIERKSIRDASLGVY